MTERETKKDFFPRADYVRMVWDGTLATKRAAMARDPELRKNIYSLLTDLRTQIILHPDEVKDSILKVAETLYFNVERDATPGHVTPPRGTQVVPK